MKKILKVAFVCFLVLMFIIIVLIANMPGKTVDCISLTDKSNIFSENDIEEAQLCVIGYFEKNFRSCVLLNIEYIENSDISNDRITLVSSFKTYIPLYSGLNLFSTYVDWKWQLEKTNGKWEIVDFGLG